VMVLGGAVMAAGVGLNTRLARMRKRKTVSAHFGTFGANGARF